MTALRSAPIALALLATFTFSPVAAQNGEPRFRTRGSSHARRPQRAASRSASDCTRKGNGAGSSAGATVPYAFQPAL